MGFSAGSDSKESACSAGDTGSIPGLRRYPGEGNGNPLQYSCLGNPTDRVALWATVHGVPKSRTQLSNWHTQGRGASNLLSDLLKPAKLSKRSSTDITYNCCLLCGFLVSMRLYKAVTSMCPRRHHVKLLQSCPSLCDPMECSPPGSSVHGILQGRILQWVAISFSRGTFLTLRSKLSLFCLLQNFPCFKKKMSH